MRKIYICSALRGNVDENIRKARCFCEYVAREYQAIPIAPHIYFTQFLNDEIYGFLSMRLDDCSVLDYIKRAARYFLTTQQYFEWKEGADRK